MKAKTTAENRPAARMALLMGGAFLMGAGIGLCNVAGWGMDPLAVLVSGVSRSLAVSFSLCNYILYLLMAAAAWRLDARQVTVWSFMTPFACSLGIEAVMRALPPLPHSVLSFACYLAGITVMSLGIALSVKAQMGKSPYDALIYAAMTRTGKNYAPIRWGMDAAWLIVGIALGGACGVGTVAALLITGKLVETFNKLLTPRTAGPAPG